MTISSTTNRISYTGNGVTTAFAFSYPFQAQADLKVLLVVISTGAETLQTITTHYTISGTTTNGVYASGGTVNMVTAPTSLQKLVIYRDPALTQTIDLVENDALPAETLEQGLDKTILINQRTRELVDRAITLPDGFTGTFSTDLPPDINTAEVLLKVNSAGDGFEIGPTATDIADAEENAIAAAASAVAAAASAVAAAASAASVASGVFTTPLTIPEIATPSTPSSGNVKVYAKSDNQLYFLNDAGIETRVQGGLDSYGLTNVGFATSVAANALTGSLKTAAGAAPSATDPVFISFGSTTATTGQFTIVAITAATNLTISSGSTLAQRDAIASYIYWYLVYNGSTTELAASRMPYDDGSIVTTTAEGGAGGADSNSAIYSTTSITGRVRKISRLLNTQTTGGTWSSAGTELCLAPFDIKPIVGVMAKTSSQDPGTTSATKTAFDSVASGEQAFDPYSLCDLTNDRVVSSKIGQWQIDASLHLANFEASASLQIYIYKNGSAYIRYDLPSFTSGTTRNFTVSHKVDATAIGDYFEVFTSSSADSSYSIIGASGADTKSYLSLTFIK